MLRRFRDRWPAEAVKYPNDVAMLRTALEERGITGSDAEIEEEYRNWCEQFYSAGWLDVYGGREQDFADYVSSMLQSY